MFHFRHSQVMKQNFSPSPLNCLFWMKLLLSLARIRLSWQAAAAIRDLQSEHSTVLKGKTRDKEKKSKNNACTMPHQVSYDTVDVGVLKAFRPLRLRMPLKEFVYVHE